MDELDSFIQKNTGDCAVWLAVDRNRNKITAYHIGGGNSYDAVYLMDKVKYHNIDIIATDGNYTYDKHIPPNTKHIITKSETCFVEEKNSSLLEKIAQLRLDNE
jgi:IS1 family transposase